MSIDYDKYFYSKIFTEEEWAYGKNQEEKEEHIP